ncbi:site-specific integrase [Psychromonas aquimarina]|uniref:site-specific integrase n=1 Tax=Psychromonas aquimarina TaxID=444919 RepID=UPI00040C17E1
MPPPFLNSVTEMMRLKRYAKRTIENYIYWIKAFINFHHQQHPIKCNSTEVEQLLSYLANKRGVAPNTQALALNAPVFLYKESSRQIS